jgi:hypothetical protein
MANRNTANSFQVVAAYRRVSLGRRLRNCCCGFIGATSRHGFPDKTLKKGASGMGAAIVLGLGIDQPSQCRTGVHECRGPEGLCGRFSN